MQLSWIILLLTHLNGLIWSTDFSTAQSRAKLEHKQILLNFSGSDWCGPCIRLTKEVFQSADFEQLATVELVLVRADFPRAKKKQLSKEQQQKNAELAERYNEKGSFPLTLLLDENGGIIKSWEGYPANQANGFIKELRELTHE